MSKVIYIQETKQFIVDGRTIEESSLGIAEAANLKKLADSQELITGETTVRNESLIV